MDGRWPSLEVVDISHNALRTLNEATFQRALCGVRVLRLGHNRIGHLPRYVVEQLRHLESIDLRHNEIAWLDVGTFTNPTLREINLSHNRLRKIISMTFLYLPAVASIDLSYNEIGYIYKYAFYRICKDERRLIRLSFRGNRLQTDGVWKILSIFQHQENSACAVEADVSDNQARQLMGDALDFVRRQVGVDVVTGRGTADAWLSGVREQVSGAAVAEWKRFDYWRRMSLDLRGNRFNCECDLMEELDIIFFVIHGSNTGTNDSDVPDNDAGVMNFENYRVGRFLKIVGNCFSPPALQGYSVAKFFTDTKKRRFCRLLIVTCPNSCDCFDEHLNCSRRGLVGFPVTSHSHDNITTVDLSFNNLTVINGAEINLRQMESLDISHNQLLSIDFIAMTQAPNLKKLFLHENQLETLSQALLSLIHLENLTLRGNPLHCSRTCNFINKIKPLRGIVVDWDQVRCADGRRLDDIVVGKSLVDNSIDCSENETIFGTVRETQDSRGETAAVVSPVANFHVLLVLILIIVLGLIAMLAIRGQLRRKYVNGGVSGGESGGIKRMWTNVDTLGFNGAVLAQHDVFVSYSDADEAWVTGSLLEVIWNSFPNYCVCLQQHVDELHVGVTTSSDKQTACGIQGCIENSQMTIVVLSKGFVATLLREGGDNGNYRTTLLRNLDGQRHKFLFVFLEALDLDAFDAELSGYVHENTQIWADNTSFAEQLSCNLPHPLVSRTLADGKGMSRRSTADSEKGLLLCIDDGDVRQKVQEKY